MSVLAASGWGSGPGSSSTTVWPRRRSSSAAVTPNTPAPTTATFTDGSPDQSSVSAWGRQGTDGAYIPGSRSMSPNTSSHARLAAAAREPETSYRSLVENAPIAIFRSTPEGRLLSVNRAFVQMLGYESEAEVLDLDLGRDVYAEPAERARIIAQVGDQDFASAETAWRRKDGQRITVRMTGRPLRDGAGRVESYETFVEDITWRKQVEERFRALVEHASDIIVLLGPDGRILYSSPSSAPILGYDSTEELGHHYAEFIHPDDLEEAAANFRDVVAQPGAVIHSELRARRKDGTWRDLEASLVNRLDHPAVEPVDQ